MSRRKKAFDRYDPMRRLLMGQRELLKMTYDDLAAASGFSKTTVHRYVHHPEDASLNQILILCKALQVPADELRVVMPMAL